MSLAKLLGFDRPHRRNLECHEISLFTIAEQLPLELLRTGMWWVWGNVRNADETHRLLTICRNLCRRIIFQIGDSQYDEFVVGSVPSPARRDLLQSLSERLGTTMNQCDQTGIGWSLVLGP